jgi:hypothetical protein
MIDHSDSDSFWIVSMLTSGPTSFVCAVIAIILMTYACQNEAECSKKTCPNDMRPKLMEHSCMCVTEAK